MQHTNSKKAKVLLKIIAETIKDNREKLNKSQRVLADEFDIQKSLISRIENGKNEPKIISVWSVCDALGIKISELFREVEEKLPNDFSLVEK